jgi:hypothetical protein
MTPEPPRMLPEPRYPLPESPQAAPEQQRACPKPRPAQPGPLPAVPGSWQPSGRRQAATGGADAMPSARPSSAATDQPSAMRKVRDCRMLR